MKKISVIRYPLSVICVICLLSGCASMLENEYEFVTPHADTSPESASDAGTLRAGNYSELKGAILRLVRSGAAGGVVRLHNYTGNADDDTQAACRSVLIEEPIGAYALDFLNYEIVPLLVDYDVNLSLLRRRTADELRAVKSVSGPSEFRERFEALLEDYGTSMTVETNFYQDASYDLPAMLSDLYDRRPIAAQGRPEVSGALYPEKGLRRVIELQLTYPFSQSVMLTREKRCLAEVEELPLSDETYAPLAALELYDLLAMRCEFDAELYAEYRAAAAEGREIQSTIHDALVRGRALPEGYALAYKAFCDRAGINCLVVRGRHGVDEHVWNLVELDGAWYHVDLGWDMLDGELNHTGFMLTDEAMAADYRWDTAKFPAANGELTWDSLHDRGENATETGI